MDADGVQFTDRAYVTDLLSRVKLSQEKGSLKSYCVTPSDLGHEIKTTRRDTVYLEAANLGFIVMIQEYCVLLARKLARQFKETGTCDLDIGEWLVVAIPPIVDSRGYSRLLYVSRRKSGVYLHWYYGRPDDEWFPAYQFLFGLPCK